MIDNWGDALSAGRFIDAGGTDAYAMPNALDGERWTITSGLASEKGVGVDGDGATGIRAR